MPKVIDHDERRREIVEVAKRIILKGGFEAATMRSIAAEAGFANGALKHYFPGKESIVAATFESVLSDYVQRMEAQGLIPDASSPTRRDVSAFDRLSDFLRMTLLADLGADGEGRILLALWEYAMSNDELAALYRAHLTQWRTRLVSLMEQAREEGAIRSGLAYGALADEFISVTIGATVVSLIRSDGREMPDYGVYLRGFLDRLR